MLQLWAGGADDVINLIDQTIPALQFDLRTTYWEWKQLSCSQAQRVWVVRIINVFFMWQVLEVVAMAFNSRSRQEDGIRTFVVQELPHQIIQLNHPHGQQQVWDPMTLTLLQDAWGVGVFHRAQYCNKAEQCESRCCSRRPRFQDHGNDHYVSRARALYNGLERIKLYSWRVSQGANKKYLGVDLCGEKSTTLFDQRNMWSLQKSAHAL